MAGQFSKIQNKKLKIHTLIKKSLEIEALELQVRIY